MAVTRRSLLGMLGAILLFPWYRGFIPRGPDVIPPLLSPGEMILTAEQQHILADAYGALLDSYNLKKLARELQADGGFWREIAKHKKAP